MLQPRSTHGSSWRSRASAWRRHLGRSGVGTRCARAPQAGPPQYWSASSASATWVVGACTAPSLKTTSTSRALRPPLAIDSLGGFCRPPCAFDSGFGRATTISLICLFRQITGVWITSLLDASGDCGIPPDISRGSPSERLCFAIGVLAHSTANSAHSIRAVRRTRLSRTCYTPKLS